MQEGLKAAGTSTTGIRFLYIIARRDLRNAVHRAANPIGAVNCLASMSAGNQRLRDYAAEVHALKSDIQQLKTKFYERQQKRLKLRAASVVLADFVQAIDWKSPVETEALRELQGIVAAELLDPASTLPISADALHKKILSSNQSTSYRRCMRQLRHPCLSRLVSLLDLDRHLISTQLLNLNGNNTLLIVGIDRPLLASFTGVEDPLAGLGGNAAGAVQTVYQGFEGDLPRAKRPKLQDSDEDGNLDNLLQAKTARERDRLEKGEELLELLDRKTARQQEEFQRYQTGGAAVREHCPYLTKEACRKARNNRFACHRLHQRKILYPWTDESRGNCSYLDTCRDVRRCRCIHYELDPEPDHDPEQMSVQQQSGGIVVPKYLQALQEPQWIQCDVRNFDLSVLGKFAVIMTDPPWEIHQDLPYGTMGDEELLNMGMANLQDDGVIFMWVVTRALELGREMLGRWGYRRVDELIWVKTNSLQRLNRLGRTGHWLNHSKEHCLVGYKGNPQLNRYVDCDVLVSEVRETSRKPDEMYPLLERLSPGTRKLEIFARQHNVRPGWVSLGNQLDGVYITDNEMLQRYTAQYGPPMPPRRPPPKTHEEYMNAEYAGEWTH